jgi:hypothetical protein
LQFNQLDKIELEGKRIRGLAVHVISRERRAERLIHQEEHTTTSGKARGLVILHI